MPGCDMLNPVEAVAQFVAQCPKVNLSEFLKWCFGQKKAAKIADPFQEMTGPLSAKQLVSVLCAIGMFEPRGATEPRACDVKWVYDKTVDVPAATISATTGKIIPATRKLVRFCAAQHRSLIVDKLRGLPANLTATESGEVFSKAMQVIGFSESFCAPGEPGDGDDLGTFQQWEHVVLCPGAGFDLHARNFDPFSPALFSVHAEGWSTT